MHGRVKVRTPAEQAEQKRRERQEKVRVYRDLTGRIYAKRAAGENDVEALQLTGKVLSDNPDIAVLWNYRREILQSRIPTLSLEDTEKLCDEELSFLERCLHVNPKSYCVWLQRSWVMEHCPAPDWPRDKALCDLFLKFDERNFHCWDYRRFVIEKAGARPHEELQFTEDKIHSNFSNYSAWHYRSRLLPSIHPSASEEGEVTKEAKAYEYELVHNAVFTDPNDQSAWFYHRWLLGKVDKPLAMSCLLFQRSPTLELTVVFSKPVQMTDSRQLAITIGTLSLTTSFKSDWPDSLWVCPLPNDVVLQSDCVLEVTFDSLQAAMFVSRDQQEVKWVGSVEGILDPASTAASDGVVTSELQSCLELLHMEPDNKWCLLTTLELLQAQDPQKHCKDILTYFKRLISVDPHRRGHYRDLMSKFVTERALADQLTRGSQPTDLDLSGKELSRLCHTDLMLLFGSVDLSCNQLTSLPTITHLHCAHTLLLDDNQLETLPSGVGTLRCLRVLSLRSNTLPELPDLRSLESVKELQQLEVLNLEGNPLIKAVNDVTHFLIEWLPSLRELDRVPVS